MSVVGGLLWGLTLAQIWTLAVAWNVAVLPAWWGLKASRAGWVQGLCGLGIVIGWVGLVLAGLASLSTVGLGNCLNCSGVA